MGSPSARSSNSSQRAVCASFHANRHDPQVRHEYETGWYGRDGDALLLAPDTWLRSIEYRRPESVLVERGVVPARIEILDATSLEMDDPDRTLGCKHTRVAPGSSARKP